MAIQIPTSNTQAHLSLKFFLLIACYFSLHVVLRVFISDSLDYDEAEQALLGQWLLPGYTEQPPLYTWIQYLIFETLGRNVLSISLFKNSLLFLTYIFVFFSSKRLLQDSKRAVLATCSLLLIPQIAWESQRDMTHTTLVVFAAAATLYQTLRLLEKRILTNYALLGLCLGIGVMAKANFALFVTILVATLLTFDKGRAALSNRKVLIVLAIICLMAGNYFFWMFNNQDIVFSATHKFKRAVDNYYLVGPISLITNSLLFLAPFLAISLLIFPSAYGLTDNFSPTFEEKFIKRYLLAAFLVLLIVVLCFKVTYVKDRWLQPLLFVAPIYIFSRIARNKITLARFNLFVKITIIAAIAVFIAFSIRVVGASYIERFCRMNYPFAAMVKDIKETGFQRGLIVSNNRFLAGNIQFKLPDCTAIIPDYRFETHLKEKNPDSILVVWKAERSKILPEELAGFLQATYSVDGRQYPVRYFENRYKYGRAETVTLAAIIVPKDLQ